MTREEMTAFAVAWVDNWNRRDVDAVLAHFADDSEFISPLAVKYSGQAALRGKAAIGNYWRAALQRIEVLEFSLDYVTYDGERRELAVVYVANLNGNRQRALEVMRFRADGRQASGEAFYGAAL